jgi:DNA polymerase-3 subunit epsilon
MEIRKADMREIVLDTETTGLDPADGHRIIELCCIELIGHVPTGKTFHTLIQPERDVPEEVVRVHGISSDQLIGAPVFAAIADNFLSFIGDSPFVIHNAEFDLRFLNAELARLDKPPFPSSRGIDTIQLAKRRFPGARYSLDELCRRFNIDLSGRTKHGAMIDSQLLAQVYLELIGGRQTRLHLAPGDETSLRLETAVTARPRPVPLPERISEEERQAHARFIAKELGGEAVWLRPA